MQNYLWAIFIKIILKWFPWVLLFKNKTKERENVIEQIIKNTWKLLQKLERCTKKIIMEIDVIEVNNEDSFWNLQPYAKYKFVFKIF